MRNGTSLGLVLLGVAFSLPAGATVDRYTTRGNGTYGSICDYEYTECGYSWNCVGFWGSESVENSSWGGHTSSGYVDACWNSGSVESPWAGAGCEDVPYAYSYRSVCGFGEDSVSGNIRRMSVSGDPANTSDCTYAYSALSGWTYACSETPPLISVDMTSAGYGDASRSPYFSTYANPPYSRSSYRSNGQSMNATPAGTLLVNGVDVVPVLDDEDDYVYGYNWTSQYGYLNIYKY